MPARSFEATGAAQAVLRTVAPWLQIDGQWGKTTSRIYTKAPAEVRARVDAVLKALDWDADRLMADREAKRADEWIDIDEANQLVVKSAGLYGIPQYADVLKDFVRREAVKQNGKYKITSRNGSSTGLMQMQPKAWIDAERVANKLVPGSLVGFVEGVYDAEQNIRAGTAYAIQTIGLFKKAGIPVIGDTLYLAHNQGPYGAIDLMRKGIVNEKNVALQSAEAKDLIARYKGRYAN